METEPLPYLINWIVIRYSVTLIVTYGVILLLLLFLIFLNSNFEKTVSFFQEQKRSRNTKNYPKIVDKENLRELLTAKHEVNSFLQVCIAILFHLLFHSFFQEINILGYLIQIVLTVILLFVFQNVLPRFIAKTDNGIFRFTYILLRAINHILRPINNYLLRKELIHYHDPDIDNLTHVLDQSTNNNSEEQEFLKSIVRFGHKNASEIMQSRINVIALDITESVEKVVEVINESGYSRIPVYDDTFDNIRGILYTKDLLPLIYKGNVFSWQEIIRPPFFVPESKKIDDLLKEFQRDKMHMAIVVDEYGGCSGIVTMEDILEEIVGDIMDEYDDDEEYCIKINENTYLFDGRTELDDFFKYAGVDSNIFYECKGDAETLAGLMLELKGEIPEKSEKIKWKDFTFSIEVVDDRSIKKIKFIKPVENL